MRPAPHAGPGPPLDGAEAVRSPSIEESIMAHIFFPLPSRDFDPTEVGVTWRVLTAAGHGVSVATPDGQAAAADPIMITGRGLEERKGVVWGKVGAGRFDCGRRRTMKKKKHNHQINE